MKQVRGKAANFYTAYLTSANDNGDAALTSDPVSHRRSAAGAQKQISYKRYMCEAEIIPNDRQPTRKQDQLITKPTKTSWM